VNETADDDEATLVRIDAAKGFTKDNVKVVSAKAARAIELLQGEGITRKQLLSMAEFLPDEPTEAEWREMREIASDPRLLSDREREVLDSMFGHPMSATTRHEA
jgi:hypothetical protein